MNTTYSNYFVDENNYVNKKNIIIVLVGHKIIQRNGDIVNIKEKEERTICATPIGVF